MANDYSEDNSNDYSKEISTINSFLNQVGYTLNKKISNGAFGHVYYIKNKSTNKIYACKIELSNTKVQQLEYEKKIYDHLFSKNNANNASKYLCQIHDFYQFQKSSILVMDACDHDLKKISGITVKQKMKYFLQAMDAIHVLHNNGLVHRDIKPANFLIQNMNLKLCDFGLTKCIMKNNVHIDNVNKTTQVGTLRYCSPYTQLYMQASKRDDVIALCYTFVSIFNVKLPWSKIKLKNKSKSKKAKKEKNKIILTLKRICSPHQICPITVPQSIKKILVNSFCLLFKERPPYEKYKKLILYEYNHL